MTEETRKQPPVKVEPLTLTADDRQALIGHFEAILSILRSGGTGRPPPSPPGP
jgi:hypothetical protein